MPCCSGVHSGHGDNPSTSHIVLQQHDESLNPSDSATLRWPLPKACGRSNSRHHAEECLNREVRCDRGPRLAAGAFPWLGEMQAASRAACSTVPCGNCTLADVAQFIQRTQTKAKRSQTPKRDVVPAPRLQRGHVLRARLTGSLYILVDASARSKSIERGLVVRTLQIFSAAGVETATTSRDRRTGETRDSASDRRRPSATRCHTRCGAVPHETQEPSQRRCAGRDAVPCRHRGACLFLRGEDFPSPGSVELDGRSRANESARVPPASSDRNERRSEGMIGQPGSRSSRCIRTSISRQFAQISTRSCSAPAQRRPRQPVRGRW